MHNYSKPYSKLVYLTYMNYKKNLDKFCHVLLLKILIDLGCLDYLTRLRSSYLSDRRKLIGDRSIVEKNISPLRVFLKDPEHFSLCAIN